MKNEVNQYQPQLQPISLTPKALAHLEKIIQRQGKGIGLRLAIKKAGCSGFAYDVSIAEQQQGDDQVFPLTENLAVYVSRKNFPFLQGTCIDLVTKGLNSSFHFDNPNAGVTCGCGESFGVSQG